MRADQILQIIMFFEGTVDTQTFFKNSMQKARIFVSNSFHDIIKL